MKLKNGSLKLNIMQVKNTEILPYLGEMKKRRVTMTDGRRYLIYYTFENGEMSEFSDAEEVLPEAKAKNEATEETEASENV